MESFLTHPTKKKSRIKSLDILRGFALLGILLMNIQSFSMPEAAYLNPMAYGNMTGANQWVWVFSHIFADQKFMTIFSVLFGAGILLFSENAEAKRGRSAGLHYRRTIWLLIIGLIHAHLIWHGDILVAYAICSSIVFLFRKMKPAKLFVIGLLVIAVHTLLYSIPAVTISNWPQDAIAEAMASWNPTSVQINNEIDAFTGTYKQQLHKRSEIALFMETGVLLMIFLWRAGGLMLVGMALYKWGILSAKKSSGFYMKGWLISWLIGLPIVIYGIIQNYSHNWALEYSMFGGSQYNYWGSLLVSFGFICLIMIIVKSTNFMWIKARLAAVGQMALSNYLTQSVICVFIFYGIGFGFFASVERMGQFFFVLGIWLVQLMWSKPWLGKYLFGPFEWVWRSLTYWSIQPFRKV